MIKKYFVKFILIIICILYLFKFIFCYKVKIKLGDIKMVDIQWLDNLEEWTEEQLEMKSQILKGNYIDGYGPELIEITGDNVCFDGHHRLSVLKQVNSPNYEITVSKLWFYKYKWI